MESDGPISSPPPGPKDRSRLDRRLHRLYFHGSGFQHFFSRRIRPPGIALGAVLVLAMCLVTGQQMTSVRQLFSLSFGMMLIGIPWAMTRRAKIEAKRELPRFATAGEAMTYEIRVWNHGAKRLTRAWIADTPPDARPSADDFIVKREPGEEERNGFDRILAYFRWQWLMSGNLLFSGGVSRSDIDVAAGAQTLATIRMTPLRRGIIHFNDLRVMLPDPFGLFQRCKKIKAPAATLTVLPKRYPLPPVELPGSAAFKISGEANTNSIGNSGEFVGLRDYRPGDPLRQIHWRSWARTGRPIVKELEDTFYPRYGLVVDTLSTGRTDHAFEEVISVAASFAAAIDTNESLLDLMFIKNQAHRVTAGRGLERAEKLLEVLAGVSPERTENYQTLAKLVLRHRDDLTSCLVIFNGWDDSRSRFLESLTTRGILCVPVIVGDGPIPAGHPGHWLETGKIAAGLRHLPSRLSIRI